jgi:hypothetical protein
VGIFDKKRVGEFKPCVSMVLLSPFASLGMHIDKLLIGGLDPL